MGRKKYTRVRYTLDAQEVESGEAKYIPILEAWAKVDYKKVRARINRVVWQLSA